jgi:hypothetical protein
MRLWRSPGGRKRTVGDSAFLEAGNELRTVFDQRPQISGEVTMKIFESLPLVNFVRRFSRVLRRPAAITIS